MIASENSALPPELESHGAKSLDVLRQRLLDLKKSNALLNLRFGRSYVRLIDEVPEQVFAALCRGRLFEFLAVPEAEDEDENKLNEVDAARAAGLDPSFELPEQSQAPPKKHADRFLQTRLFRNDLDAVLERLRRRSNTLLEELGVPTLHIIFGTLEWFESDASDRGNLAPLVLMQVELSRQLVEGQYRYHLKTDDETDPCTNETLRLKLRRDFRLELPELGDDPDLASYLDAVTKLVEKRPRWRVRRHMALGVFRFERLVMHEDLAAGDWLPQDHALLQRLLATRPEEAQPTREVEDLDSAEFQARAPLLISDADSSQTIAIADALDGHNLVVRGPPGTGKSQTITNLIAAALSQGKSVLFMAEKMAALDVVRKRLVDAGLGEFALELHSTKASKRQVVQQLANRLEVRPDHGARDKFEASLQELRRVRGDLNDYLRAMHQKFGALGCTLFEVLWKHVRLRPRDGTPLFQALSHVRVPGALAMTAAELRAAKNALHLVQVRRSEVRPASRGGHPWDPLIDATNTDNLLEEVTLPKVQAWRDALVALRDLTIEAYAPGSDPGIAELGQTASACKSLTLPSEPLLELADRLSAPSLRARGVQVLPSLENLAELRRLAAKMGLSLDNLHQARADVLGALERVANGPATTLTQQAGLFEGDIRASQVFQKAVGQLERAAEALGWRLSSFQPNVVEQFIRLADLVDVPREVLLQRSDPLIAERPPGVVTGLLAKVREARELAAAVDEWASGWRDADPIALREAALTLRESGFWARLFGGSYRAARRLVARMLRGERLPAEEMARRAEQCAEALEAIARVTGDPQLSTLFPAGSDWTDADLNAIQAVVEWADRVRAATADLDPASNDVRTAALRGPTDVLAGLVGVVRDLRHARASVALPREIGLDLREIAAALDSRGKTGTKAVDLLLRHGVAPHTPIVELQRLSGLLAGLEDDLRITEQQDELAAALGSHWQRLKEEPSDLARALEWTTHMADWAGNAQLKLPEGSPWSAWCAELRRWGQRVLNALDLEARARQEATSTGVATEKLLAAAAHRVGQAASLVAAAAAAPTELKSWVAFLRAWREAERIDRLRPVLSAIEDVDDDLVGLDGGFEWLVYRELTLEAQRAYPAMSSEEWSGESLHRLRSRFVEFDRRILRAQQGEIRERLLQKQPPVGNGTGARSTWTELRLIKHEVSKQKRHIPIRQLVSRSQAALLQLAPCFMMSPLSVAQFLPRECGLFDLLIIDEASQMRPEDSVGAVARAKQIVVVGDEMQLPPTSFFESSHNDDDLTDDDGPIDERLESILDWSRSSFSQARELLWHYRSRHESLIAFSNERFYGGRLLVFPSPRGAGNGQGVELRSVDGGYKSSRNEPEAEAVVSAVKRFMQEHPRRSLGVVAMNRAQAELIERLVDQEIRELGDDSYRESWKGTLEPFFVKNLERVQGDERDVMFVAMTYGPSSPGGPVAQRFGPVNGEDGHRRLNVLFTRAREKIVVFSSMKPGDIRVDARSKAGVKVLRDYLEYAGSGGRLLTPQGIREREGYDSPFEESVDAVLRAEGFETTTQVGVQGFFIDLGVRHPSYPGGYFCGVECDGAAYHSTKSARDRDRIRQAVLEGLGWRIIRVWSTDWFRDPLRARQKLVQQVRDALQGATESATRAY